MTRRFARWWVTWAIVGVLLGVLLYLATGGRHSTPRSEAAAPAGDSISAAAVQPQSGAPNAADAQLAEPGTAGAPSPGLALGIGRRVQHRAERASGDLLARPAPSPSSSPRPTGATSPVRAGTAGGSVCDRTGSPAAFNGLHPIAESWRTTGTASGKASHMGSRFPSWYLALPIGPGYFVRIVGPGGHVEMCSTDAGPDLQMQRGGRVADLSVAVFTHVCGVPASMGLCQVSVTLLGRSR